MSTGWTYAEISKVFLTVWAILGPLVGIALGSYLTVSSQKRHWIADSKKQEYRDLLSVLTKASFQILDFRTPMVAHGPDEQRAYHEIKWQAVSAIGSCLFTADEIKTHDIMGRWRQAIHHFEKTGNAPQFSDACGRIAADIISAAQKLMD